MNANEIIDFIKSRRSIRKFKKTIIPEEDVQRAIEAACFAPSNGNYQPWRFLYIKDEDIKKDLGKIIIEKIDLISKGIEKEEWKEEFRQYSGYFTFFSSAPGIIVALYKKAPSILRKILKNSTDINETNSELSSISAATENMLLMLHAMGYGACWMTGPLLIAKKEIEGLLNIKKPFEIAALIPFGIPDERREPPRRKGLTKIFTIK
jgi:nitroreductase